MSTTLTPSAARGTVTVPTGTDRVNIADLTTTAMQAILNRAEWASKSLIVASVKEPDMRGNDYVTAGTSYATVANGGTSADFALTLSVGDVVWLDAAGDAEMNAQAYGFSFRWFDGTTELTSQYINKAAAWTVGETMPFSLGCLYIATSAGAVTFSFQAKADNALLSVTGSANGEFQARCIHIKLGAA